jgi:radical SAM superfamily enzyme YgiQ (UPF0313 family)
MIQIFSKTIYNFYFNIIDSFTENLNHKETVKKIKKFKSDIVGISCLTPSVESSFSIAREIKKNNKDVKVVFGNLHASLFAEDILKKNIADIIVHGEGEYTFLEVVKTLEKKGNLKDVKSISFKKNNKIINTPKKPLLKNLDELPYPAWELFPYKQYGFLPFVTIKKPALSVLASRGCPFHCKFCALGYMGIGVRKRSVKNIVDEIEYLINNFNVKMIGFVDPLFPSTKKYGLDFCNEMISRGLNKKISWICETRVDCVDKELLKKMKEAGCARILFGIESGVQELLDNVNKGFTIEQVKRAVKLTKEVGITTVGFFMLGLPGETKKLSEKTIKFSKEIGLDFAKFAITVPLPGCELYEELVEQGKLDKKNWEMFTTFNPNSKKLPYIPKGMTGKELIELQKKGNFGFYMRPSAIFNLIFKVRTVGIEYLLYGFYLFLTEKILRI